MSSDAKRGGSSTAEELAAAVRANDAARVAATLERHPGLKSRLDHPMPGEAFGATPLLGAVHRANREMVDILLAAGADINARSHWWAGSFGVLDDDRGLASFLIERGAVVDVHAAARLGMLDRLAALVAADPGCVHARGGDGQTPLHFASTIEVADYLLDHGAEIDARDIDHESTPAQFMMRDRQVVARHLVARGCRTDILMLAALGDVERVRTCLDADPAIIRTRVSDRCFPKQDPRSGGTIYIWTLGAYKTAHLLAHEHGHDEVFRLLMERSPAALELAVAGELGDEARLTELLARRPDLTRTLTADDHRWLADAAHNNETEAVRLMLAAGWPVDVRGESGATPLHWAAWHGNPAMVREILRYQPPVDVRDHQYDASPLGWALHGSKHGWHPETGDYAGTVEALLAAGAETPALSAELDVSDAVLAVLRRRADAK